MQNNKDGEEMNGKRILLILILLYAIAFIAYSVFMKGGICPNFGCI